MSLLQDIKRSLQKPRFKVLTVLVTNICNAKCGTCFYWQNLNTPVDALSLDEYQQIANKIDYFETLLIGGGEPTLAPQLPEIVDAFVKHPWQSIVMPTNGIKTKQIIGKVETILRNKPDNRVVVGVSIDGLEELCDDIRGVPGLFRNACKTLEALAGLKQSYPKLRVTTLTVVINKNQHEICDLLRYLHSLGFADYHTVEPLRDLHPDERLGAPDAAMMAQIHQTCNELSAKTLCERYPEEAPLMLSHIRALNDEQIHVMKAKRMRFDCRAGEVVAVIEPNGDVRNCELLEVVANLRDHEYDLMRALQAQKALAERKYIKTRACSCTHCVNVGQSLPHDFIAEIKRIFDERKLRNPQARETALSLK